jgi:pimeloyl-ACP methyl ester carboxylesterase
MLHITSNQLESENLLLCLHGNSVASTYFLTLVKHLKHWKVVATDLVGHGASPRLDPDNYTLDNLIHPITDIMDKFHFKNLAVIGHSMGGHLALQMLEKLKPQKILLMNAPALCYSANIFPYNQLPGISEDESKPVEERVHEMVQKITTHAPTQNFVSMAFMATDPCFRLGLEKEIQLGKFKDEKTIIENNSNCKVTYLSGDLDNIVNKEYELWLKNNVPFHSWIELTNAGHYPLLENEESTLHAISNWLTK